MYVQVASGYQYGEGEPSSNSTSVYYVCFHNDALEKGTNQSRLKL